MWKYKEVIELNHVDLYLFVKLKRDLTNLIIENKTIQFSPVKLVNVYDELHTSRNCDSITRHLLVLPQDDIG